jgi:serine/threonine-protein kinase
MAGQDCPSYEELFAFRAGRLASESFELLARHLESCAGCLSVLEQVAPPDDFLQAALRTHALPDPFSREPQFQAAERRFASHFQVAESTPNAGGTLPTIPFEEKTPAVNAGPAIPFPAFRENLGRYENLGVIKKGGMGVIYRARDPLLGRTVALKMIKGPGRPEDLERFLLEARAVAQLKHDNIIKIHDFGQLDGEPYFTMEVAERGSLLDHLQRFQKDPKAAVRLLAKVARAVQHVHEHKIVHRDLKPGNILLEDSDKPLVSDFGLAKWEEGDKDLTHPGGVPGTAAYMAPEQFAHLDQRPRPHSDIWALGVILFEVLLGQKPFSGGNWHGYAQAIVSSEPPRPRALQPRLHRDLETILLKCLDKNPARRYASAAELADDLERWLRGEPILAGPLPQFVRVGRWIRRHKTLTATAILLLAAPVGLVLALQIADPERPLRQMQQLIDDEGSLSILSQNGEVRWFQWRTRKSEFKSLGNGLGAIRFETFRLGLLEVYRNARQEDFEFKAKIRHDQSELGQAGLFFGLHSFQTQEGPVMFFASLAFTDLDEIVSPNAPGGPKPNPLGLRLHLYREAHEAASIGALGPVFVRAGSFGSFVPSTQAAANGKGPWRELAVRVNSESIRWTFSGGEAEAHGELTRATFLERARKLLTENCKELQEQEVNFPPHGGLGLVVECGEAAFKDIVISHLQNGGQQTWRKEASKQPTGTGYALVSPMTVQPVLAHRSLAAAAAVQWAQPLPQD